MLSPVCPHSRNSKLREQAIEVLRDLLASHDSDSRYNSPESRACIASIYLPLLSVVMDNFQVCVCALEPITRACASVFLYSAFP